MLVIDLRGKLRFAIYGHFWPSLRLKREMYFKLYMLLLVLQMCHTLENYKGNTCKTQGLYAQTARCIH